MSCEEFGEPKVWTTKDGEEIAYHDLTDRHLDNIINFLARQESAAWSVYCVVSGEAASESIESDIASLEAKYEEMVAERDRRAALKTRERAEVT